MLAHLAGPRQDSVEMSTTFSESSRRRQPRGVGLGACAASASTQAASPPRGNSRQCRRGDPAEEKKKKRTSSVTSHVLVEDETGAGGWGRNVITTKKLTCLSLTDVECARKEHQLGRRPQLNTHQGKLVFPLFVSPVGVIFLGRLHTRWPVYCPKYFRTAWSESKSG